MSAKSENLCSLLKIRINISYRPKNCRFPAKCQATARLTFSKRCPTPECTSTKSTRDSDPKPGGSHDDKTMFEGKNRRQ